MPGGVERKVQPVRRGHDPIPEDFVKLYTQIARLPMLATITEMDGPSLEGGLEQALVCDIPVAAQDVDKITFT